MKKKIFTAQDLTKLLVKEGIYEGQEFVKFATLKEKGKYLHPEAQELHWEMATRQNWVKNLTTAVKAARAYTPDTPYLERIEQWEIPNNFSEIWGDLHYRDYRKILEHHDITKERLQRWFATLASDNGKRNTIYMCGHANGGKTTIIELLSAFYEPWEIGRAQPQSAQSSFFLQDLVGKRLFHADEILATPLNIDTLKLLL